MVGIKKENKIDYEDFPEGPLDFWENYQGQIMGIINIVKNVKNNYDVEEDNNKNLNNYQKFCTKLLVPRNGINE